VLRYDEGLFIGYRAVDRDGREPLYSFGHGMGYTTWVYHDLSVRTRGLSGFDGVEVRVDMRNTGTRRGREVVQVYASRGDSAIERPVKWLAGFAVVDADAGRSVTATIRVPERVFQHWNGSGWETEPGEFTLAAGPSSARLPLSAVVNRDG
jgi:beta-glucosidase